MIKEFTEEEVKKIIDDAYPTQGSLIEQWRKDGCTEERIAELIYYEM